MKPDQLNKKIEYLDALRTIACFAVVMLHVTALNTYNVEFKSHEWNVFMFYESLVNWAVPVFVMISGVLMLQKNYSFYSIFSKIRTVVIIYFAWSMIYLLKDMLINSPMVYLKNFAWLQILIQGHYHMWFLTMISGIYMIAPFIRAVVIKPVYRKYFILLAFIFTFLAPSVKDVISVHGGVLQISIIAALYRGLSNVYDNLTFHLTIGFVAYFVIGYAIEEDMKRLIGQKELPVGFWGLLLGSLIVFFEIRHCISKENSGLFMQYYQVGILLQSVGILVIVRHFSETEIIKLLSQISPITFGVYIIHPLFIEVLQKLGITSLSFPAELSVPVLTLLIFYASAVTVRVCLNIPIVRRIMRIGKRVEGE